MLRNIWSYATLVYRYNAQHALALLTLATVRAELEAALRKVTQ